MTDRQIETNPGWTTEVAGSRLTRPQPQDEFLHPPPPGAGYAWTETSYWGFCVPERGLMAEIYIWFHPVLNTMSAGVLIWRGMQPTSLASDYVHHHHFLPMPADIAHYRIEPLGLEIEVLEPLKRARMRMQDPDRDVSFEVTFTGVLPPLGRPNGHHLVQPLHVRGSLNLYGEQIAIDGHFMRDRSWGAERHETPRDLPPITWMTGIVDASWSFHLVAFDDPALGPDWQGRFANPKAGENLMWGYLHEGTQTTSIRAVRKRTLRDADGVSPTGFEIEIEDERGRRLPLRGTVTARVPWATWQNIVVYYSLTRWELEGRVAWGDCQDIHYNRFVHEFTRRAPR
ncbi:MAG: hypothetical protein JSS29_01665 [Proteobacteria bacterium]|nr:hypothetical protein [Pseudomonadota bacterium]